MTGITESRKWTQVMNGKKVIHTYDNLNGERSSIARKDPSALEIQKAELGVICMDFKPGEAHAKCKVCGWLVSTERNRIRFTRHTTGGNRRSTFTIRECEYHSCPGEAVIEVSTQNDK